MPKSLLFFSNQNCEENLLSEYKFYLSFDNSLCKEYTTEKTFLRMQQFVSVVYTWNNFTQRFPQHSFINALDFPTPKVHIFTF